MIPVSLQSKAIKYNQLFTPMTLQVVLSKPKKFVFKKRISIFRFLKTEKFFPPFFRSVHVSVLNNSMQFEHKKKHIKDKLGTVRQLLNTKTLLFMV